MERASREGHAAPIEELNEFRVSIRADVATVREAHEVEDQSCTEIRAGDLVNCRSNGLQFCSPQHYRTLAHPVA